jgi:hypothetical protein
MRSCSIADKQSEHFTGARLREKTVHMIVSKVVALLSESEPDDPPVPD